MGTSTYAEDTTGATWVTWTCSSSDTASTSSTSIVWGHWSNATATVTTCSDNVWVNWTSSGVITAPAYTDADYAAQRLEHQRLADEAAEKRRLATARARELLESVLDHQQREQLQRSRFFDMIVGQNRRRYRIHHGTHGNVRLLDDTGREVVRYCAQPDYVPTEDAMAAQKLMLESDEDAFLRVANATRLTA
jgi:hypothetical protein